MYSTFCCIDILKCVWYMGQVYHHIFQMLHASTCKLNQSLFVFVSVVKVFVLVSQMMIITNKTTDTDPWINHLKVEPHSSFLSFCNCQNHSSIGTSHHIALCYAMLCYAILCCANLVQQCLFLCRFSSSSFYDSLLQSTQIQYAICASVPISTALLLLCSNS